MQLQSLKTAAVEIPELKMLIQSLPLTLRTPSCTDGLTKFKALKALLQTKLLLLCNLLVYIVKQIIILNALAYFGLINRTLIITWLILMIFSTDLFSEQELAGFHFLCSIPVHQSFYKQTELMSDYTIWSAIFVDKSTSCPPINIIFPFTQMPRDKKKKIQRLFSYSGVVNRTISHYKHKIH